MLRLPFGKKSPEEKLVEKKSMIPSAFRPSIVNPSQKARPFIGSSFSSSQRDIAPVLITFDGWNKGGIFDWYRETARMSRTTIRKLELHKERDNFKHEFVVVYLEGGDIYRIDRRPLGGGNAETVSSKGCPAEDSVLFVNKKELEAIQSNTDTEVTVDVCTKKKPDLYAVIAICVSVLMDSQSKSYTLQMYNCYFLARTITTLMVRHLLLQSYVSHSSLRWDSVSETAISDYMSRDDWRALDVAMRTAVITVLENMLWPVVKADAETLIEKRKHWGQLETVVKQVIRDTVENSAKNLVGDSVKRAMVEWLLEATQATLWHDNLDNNLSAPQYRSAYETVTGDLLKETLKAELHNKLPADMVTKLANILPQRLLSRLPPALLANLPGELLGRIPVKVLEKLPDDLLARAPIDVLLKAPDDLFQKISTHVYSKLPNNVLLSLPEDLNRIPDELLHISLQRIQEVLGRPEDPDRPLALKLLRRFPDSMKRQIPPEYTDMPDQTVGDQPKTQNMERDTETESDAPSSERSVLDIATINRSRFSLSQVSILGMVMRATPRPILGRLPQSLMMFIPISWLRTLPEDALSVLPERYLSKMTAACFERLPDELLGRVPETLLQKLPRATLERLPDALLLRLPMRIIKNLPPELMENLPEELSDVLREKISSQAFDGPEMMDEVTKTVGGLVKGSLLETKGELSDNILRLSVRSKSKAKDGYVAQSMKTHEQLQARILDMTRKHSRMVAQVAHFGVGEDAVYNELRTKTADVWRVMRLHSTPLSRSG
ncbi:hypothetical protein AX17_002617 [Amanita inopinata Kibby_2008]|nr:hypothetical protein AX17_002617 [Amanita inopinata Kibby_2008]